MRAIAQTEGSIASLNSCSSQQDDVEQLKLKVFNIDDYPFLQVPVLSGGKSRNQWNLAIDATPFSSRGKPPVGLVADCLCSAATQWWGAATQW